MNYIPSYKSGDLICGNYKVFDYALGGMSEVYFCVSKDNMLYAMKTPRMQLYNRTRLDATFKIEARNWVNLGSHPNIVTCYLYERFDNRPFLCLEWIIGDDTRHVNLRTHIGRSVNKMEKALGIGFDVCRGLAYAEEMIPGFVHCDLKPENILITSSGVAKVTDFGLAKIVGDAHLGIEQLDDAVSKHDHMIAMDGIVGTPAYMAPEQWNHRENLDARTDIYAIGLILYEVLTGYHPFLKNINSRAYLKPGEFFSLIKDRHEKMIPEALPAFVPVQLSQIVMKCLEKRKEDRFQSITELFLALTETYERETHKIAPMLYVNSSDLKNPQDYNAVEEAFREGNWGQSFQNMGMYTEALQHYDRSIQLISSNSNAYARRGLAHAYLGNTQQALEDVNHAVEINNSDAVVYRVRGEVFEKLGRSDEALDDYFHAVSLDSNQHWLHERLGTLLYELKRYDEALKALNEAERTSPSCDHTLIMRGKTYRSLGLLENALSDFDSAIRIKPDCEEAFSQRGQIMRMLGKYADALKDLNCAISINPQSTYALGERGEVYRCLKSYSQSLEDFEAALKLTPTDTFARAHIGATFCDLGDFESALSNLNQVPEENEQFVLAILIRGEVFFRLQQFSEALAEFEHVLILQPDLIQAIEWKARTLMALGENGLALEEYKRFSGYFSSPPVPILIQMATICQKSSEFEQALEYYKHVIVLKPDIAFAHLNIAKILIYLDRHQEAVEFLTKSIELEPDNCDPLVTRGQVYQQIGKFENALSDFNQAILLTPEISGLYQARGQLLERFGRYEDAIRDYDETLRLSPNNDSVLVDRGAVNRILNRLDASANDYSLAIKINPNNVIAYNNRGNAYHYLQQYDNAISDRTQAIKLDPNYDLAYFNRGNSYADIGQVDAAIADYLRTIELNSQYLPAYSRLGIFLFELGREKEALPFLQKLEGLGSKYIDGILKLLRAPQHEKNETNNALIAIAFSAILEKDTPRSLEKTVRLFPFLINNDFIEFLENSVLPNLPKEEQVDLAERIAWLGEIAFKQEKG